MTARSARRRRAVPTGPSPEVVAGVIVAVLYAGVLTVAAVFGGTPPRSTPAVVASPSPVLASPSAAIDRVRTDINALLEVNGRLYQARDDLRKILAQSKPRGSEVAFVLRRIRTALLPGVERVGRLTAEPVTHEIGAQLEILYANAGTTVDRAADLALGSDPAYQQVAQDIVDLFSDLPTIDAELRALLRSTSAGPGPSEGSAASAGASGMPAGSPSVTPRPSASPTPTPTPRPSAAARPSATTKPSTGPLSPSPSAPVIDLLRDGGFENGIASWIMQSPVGTGADVVAAGPPLGAAGIRSLQVAVPAVVAAPDVAIGQTPIQLRAGHRYAVGVELRGDSMRTAQIRVVGPQAETYAIRIVSLGPEATRGELDFIAPLDDPFASLWIDIGGPTAGTVWLDDASLVDLSGD